MSFKQLDTFSLKSLHKVLIKLQKIYRDYTLYAGKKKRKKVITVKLKQHPQADFWEGFFHVDMPYLLSGFLPTILG